MSTSSPYKRYFKVFYKGLGLAHWVYDRDHFAVSVGFNRGTFLYSRGRWTKVKPGGYPSVFVGCESRGRRVLWSVDGADVHVIPWEKLLDPRSRVARRTERVSADATVAELCVIDDIAFAVDDAGNVLRRTSPVTAPEGTWEVLTTLAEPLVAIAGRSSKDLWVASEESVWRFHGSTWKRVRLPRQVGPRAVACGSKDVYVCGSETVVRIDAGGRAKRFDAEGCDFGSAAFYKGQLYLNAGETDDEESVGIWTLTRTGLERVNTGFPPGWEYQPCGQLEVRAGLLWSFGSFGVYVFDGKRWDMLPNPKV